MEVRDWEELKKELCKKIDSIKSRGNLGMSEIDVLDKLTHSIKSINKIMEDEEGGYSQAGYSQRRGRRNYSRDGYSSDGNYSGDGSWASENSYDGGNSYRGRGYSRAVGDDVRQSIRKMISNGNLSMADRNTLEDVMGMFD